MKLDKINKIKELKLLIKNKIILLAGIPILFFSFADEALSKVKETNSDERVKAKAALEYVIDGKHQNLGSVGVEADLVKMTEDAGENEILYFSSDIETRILKSGMNFDIDTVRTNLEIGAKEKSGDYIFKGFFGHERLDNVDREGSKSGDVIGISLESSATANNRKFNYKLAAEKFIKTNDLDADYALKADVDYGLLRRKDFVFSLNGILDSIIDDGFSTEYRIGPKFKFLRQEGNNVSLLAQYFNSDNPLGINGEGYIFGLEFNDGFDIDSRIFRRIKGGLEAAKTFNGNSNNEFELDLDLARFNLLHRDYNWFLDIKHRINDKENDLGYNLITGFETPVKIKEKEAIGFFDINHISYHNLNKENKEESRDILEAGLKTYGWDKGYENSGIDFDKGEILRRTDWKVSLGKFRESEDGNFNIDLKGRYNFDLWKSYYVPYLEGELNEINNGGNEGVLEAGIRTKNNLSVFMQYRDDDFLNQENLIGIRYSF